MMNRRIMASLLVLGVVGALAGGSTLALFNDTETSDTNTFQAGAVEVDMETPPGQPLAQMEDVKPGDVAEEEVEVEVEGNPAFVEMRLNESETNHETGCTEPEREAEGGDCGDEGELRENTHLTVWHDDNSNGEADDNEEVILENPSDEAEELHEGVMIDADPSTEEIDPVTDSKNIMYRWEVPRSLGNEAQTDTFSYNLHVRAEQARHNGPENAAEWYQVTGEDAGEPVNDTNETEDNESQDDNQEADEQDDESSDDSSNNATGFSDEEQSDDNEVQADSETSDDNESDEATQTPEQEREEQEESDNTTDTTSQEDDNSSTGQFSAGAAGAAGLLLVLFATAGALYRKRL